MRIRRWLICGALMLLLAVLLLLRIIPIHSVVFPEAAEQEGFRLTFVCGDALNESSISEYWSKCVAGIRDAARARNSSVSLLSCDSDYSLIADVYDSAVLAGAEGLICVGVDVENLGAHIGAAAQRGIPTVCLDGDVPGSGRVCYVGTDNAAAGGRAAQVMLSRLGGHARGTALVLYPGFTTPQFDERVQGFREAITAGPGLDVVVDQRYAAAGGMLVDHPTLLGEALAEHPDVVGVFCPGTPASARMAAVLAEMGLTEDICFVCCDDYQTILEAIRAGWIDTAVVQQPYEMGKRAVDLLVDCLENGDADIPDAIYIPTFELDADSVGEYAGEAGGSIPKKDTGSMGP